MDYYHFLWLFFVFDVISCSNCPFPYSRYSKDHTICRKSTIKLIKRGLTEADKAKILKIHNKLRNKVAIGRETPLPPSANMIEMEWDEELARVAQAHADLGKFEHDRGDQRAVDNFGVGQNLLIYSGTLNINWDGIALWYTSEVKYFQREYIKPFVFNSEYGHLSQIIWAKTWKVGCGIAAYNDGQNKVLYTCNYGPGGNVLGETAYIQGPPASKCPKNTRRSTIYPGLCKSITRDGPQRERPSRENSLLFCDFGKEDSEKCRRVQITSSKNLETKKLYSGLYKTAVLNPGDKITIKLGNFQHKGGMCPFVIIRLGPNLAGQTVGSTVNIRFCAPRVKFSPYKKTTSHSTFVFVGLLMKYDGKANIKITLEVNPGSPPQYFDIKAFGVGAGKCPSYDA